MTPWEAMERLTHYQYRICLAWIERDWEEPSRTDYYLMQIAAEVQKSRVKKPAQVDMNKLKLKFQKKGKSTGYSPADPKDRQEIDRKTAASKAAWMAAMTMPVIKAKQGDDIEELRREHRERAGKTGRQVRGRRNGLRRQDPEGGE